MQQRVDGGRRLQPAQQGVHGEPGSGARRCRAPRGSTRCSRRCRRRRRARISRRSGSVGRRRARKRESRWQPDDARCRRGDRGARAGPRGGAPGAIPAPRQSVDAMAPSARPAAMPTDTAVAALAHDLETESHLANGLAASRRERNEVAAVHDQEEREQREQGKHAPVCARQPAQAQGEVERDRMHAAEQHHVEQRRQDTRAPGRPAPTRPRLAPRRA